MIFQRPLLLSINKNAVQRRKHPARNERYGFPIRGGTLQHLGSGQVFYEGPNDVHTVARNASKTKPAKFVVFLVKDESAPLVIPAQ